MQALYDSPWHHPFISWLVTSLFLLFLARKLRFFHGFLLIFGLEIIADALMTGGWAPLSSKSPWAQPIAIAFVVLGDLRYFLLLGRFLRRHTSAKSRYVVPIAISLVIPTISGVSSRLLPGVFSSSRHIFLGYELMFFVLATLIRVLWLPKAIRSAEPGYQHFLKRLTEFEMVQYAGWAMADIIILAGVSAGHGLRLVPNIMYYAAFLPFAYWVAPEAEKAAAPLCLPLKANTGHSWAYVC